MKHNKKSVRVAPTIDIKVANYYRKHYPTCNFGVKRAIDSWLHLRKTCLKQMKGFFTEEELDHLIEISTGSNYSASDGVFGKSLMLRHGLTYLNEDLEAKLKAIDAGQSLILCDWIDNVLAAQDTDEMKLHQLKKELYP